MVAAELAAFGVADPGQAVGASGIDDGAELVEVVAVDGEADHRGGGGRLAACTRHGNAMLAELHRQEPTVKQILKRLDPGIADFELDKWAGKNNGPSGVMTGIQKGLGILGDQDEWAVKLQPDAPVLPADQFHPWVWDPARTLWEAGHYR